MTKHDSHYHDSGILIILNKTAIYPDLLVTTTFTFIHNSIYFTFIHKMSSKGNVFHIIYHLDTLIVTTFIYFMDMNRSDEHCCCYNLSAIGPIPTAPPEITCRRCIYLCPIVKFQLQKCVLWTIIDNFTLFYFHSATIAY